MQKNIIILFFLTLSIIPVYSEVFILRDIKYTVDGSTRESVIDHYLSIDSGTTFNNELELNTFIDKKRQAIINQRTLSSGEISVVYSQIENDIIYVDLDIQVKDTWNYVVLPYPQYDSNTGLTIGFRAKNYNFLGGMETLSLSFDYLKLDEGGTEFNIGTDFDVPFYVAGLEWKLNFAEDMTISPEAPFKNDIGVGLDVIIPVKHINLLASINQNHYLNQDGYDDEDGYYLSTSGSVGAILSFGDIQYTPSVITSFPYKFSGDLSLERKGYQLGVAHSVSYGNIDWFGNFRNGFKVAFSQNLQYNFTRELWVNSQELDVQYHKTFGWSGVSSRLNAFFDYNSLSGDSSIGSEVRGIRNDRLIGDSAIVLNLDFPITFPIGPLGRWFDAQASPFIDYALVKPVDGNYDISEGWYGAGFEGFAFLNASRSVYLRGSLGFDMEAIFDGTGITGKAARDDSGIWELKIVVGHHY